MQGQGFYEPVRFNGFPELKESLISGHLPATFMLAPLAMKLRQEGVPIKIVYLGHRDGTAMMVHKDSDIYQIKDLKGKTIAVPNRYSNQYLIIFKALRDNGMTIGDVNIVEMPPPDMPAALYSKAVDAITSGEPFMAQTQLENYGRVLYQAKEVSLQERLMGDFRAAKGLKARLSVANELLKNLTDLADKNTAVAEAIQMLNTEIASHQRTLPTLALEAIFVRDELRATAGAPASLPSPCARRAPSPRNWRPGRRRRRR